MRNFKWFDQMHILFRCTNHSNLPFYKHSLVVIYWSLYLSSTADMLSSDLTFYIHQTIYASVPPNLITSSSLTGQISLPRIILHKTTGHNLPSVPKIKPLVRKSSKSLKVTYPLFFFCWNAVDRTSSSSFFVTKITWHYSAVPVPWFRQER